MNASTSGPHILLFERDQQLAGLLIGELQLAGYDCHTARTAVEVFDAIARLSIRLILVNLSQAAAARREFWVALDTQRRGRGIQVLTFNCTNIAGYGARDFDDHATSTPADVEVDGMLGVMGLVDAVRARIPAQLADTSTNTAPRLSHTPSTPGPSNIGYSNSGATQPGMQRPAQPMPTPGFSGVGNSSPYRSHSSPEHTLPPLRTNTGAYNNQPNQANSIYNSPAPMHQGMATQPTPQQSAAPEDLSQPSSYTDKIHAVLYPNQRAWTPQNNAPASGTPDNKYEAQSAILSSFAAPSANSAPPPSSGSSLNTLQRLANGQMDGAGESGLAQLSRLIQSRQTPPAVEPAPAPFTPEASPFRPAPLTNIPEPPRASTAPAYPEQTLREEAPLAPPPPRNTSYANESNHFTTSQPVQSGTERPYQFTGEHRAVNRPTRPSGEYFMRTASESAAQEAHTPPQPASDQIISQPMRPAPIQDMPVERNNSGPQTNENASRRPDVLSRANYGQSSTVASPLASIATASPTPPAQQQTTTPHIPVVSPSTPEGTKLYTPPEEATAPHSFNKQQDVQENLSENHTPTEPLAHDKAHQEKVSHQQDIVEQIKAEMKRAAEEQGEKGGGASSNSSVLIDIMQSLPPMPAPPPQPPQPQVLNGRATRSLGSVLLEGHLVPENRLDVAQNIQRMLRGVDLNYQLGEILLMFKLLTPDQLLAASLVSYGMINTTQIGALGRIRQELHAMGLEYDLENLLIMFRILTPEQLREAKSDW